jgi:UDP-N-acetyl-2-amino-2-deoxyglucuronate dehydrogenase
LPAEVAKEKTTYRSLTVDDEEVEFSDGFTDLHTRSYEEIVAGRGFGLDEIRPCINIVSDFRKATISANRGERHPFARRYLS